MRRSVSFLAAVGLAATVMLWSAAPATAGVVSTTGRVLSGVGGTILGVGKSVVCKGASAAGTAAEGATTVGGAAVGGASTEGAGTAEGAAAGSVIGGVIKKGIGGVTNLDLLKQQQRRRWEHTGQDRGRSGGRGGDVRSRRALDDRSGAEDHRSDRLHDHQLDLAAAHGGLVSAVVRAHGRARRGTCLVGDADRFDFGGGAA